MLKALYKKVMSIDNQMRINHFLRTKVLGDVGYLRLQKRMNAGALSTAITDTGTLFFHIPKAAGTSVVRALYGNNGVGHFPASALKEADSAYFNKAFRFTVTREPYDRLVSAFEFARQGGTEDVSFFAGHDMGGFPQDFDTFVLEWLTKADFNKCDYVFRPQSWFVCDQQGELLVNKLYQMGDMATLAEDLSAHTGREIRIPVTNKINRDKGIDAYYTNPAVLETVNRLYANDFEALGYPQRTAIKPRDQHDA